MSRKRKQSRRSTRSNPRQGTLRLAAVIAVLVGINLYVFLWRGGTSIPAVMEKAAVAGSDQGALLDAQEDALAADMAAEAQIDPGGENAPEGRVVRGAVGAGDSMGQILRREGLEPGDADELIRALSGSLDFRKIQAGQSFELGFDAGGTLQDFSFQVSRTSSVRVQRQRDGTLKAEKIEASTQLRKETLGGEIQGSLYRAMKRSGEDTGLVAFFVDVFAYDLNFYIDTHPGDIYRLIVEKEYLDDEFIGYGRVLAAEYSGQAGTFHAFWWKKPGSEEGAYYDAKGQAVEKTLLKTPLKFARVSSGFNPSRMHPVLHVRKGHWGTDFAAPPGTPIWSAASGRISYRGPRGGAGNCVIVDHDNGLQTVYMHMSKFHRGQKVGSRVRAKDVIGYVGSTGLATGPHLHFGVKKNGHYVDAQKLKMTRSVGIAKNQMPRFTEDTRELVAALSEISTEPPPQNPFIAQI